MLQATVPERKIKAIAKDARGSFAHDDAGALTAKLSEPCHYCDFVPLPGEGLNGLDRVQPGSAYDDAGTVPCCGSCNARRNVMHADDFVAQARKIARHTEASVPSTSGGIVPARRRLPVFSGRADLRAAPRKEKARLLTEDQEIALWGAPCYLCGVGPALGIDREDASGDYTPENGRPCCTACNYMKKDLALDDFKLRAPHPRVGAHRCQVPAAARCPPKAGTPVSRWLRHCAPADRRSPCSRVWASRRRL